MGLDVRCRCSCGERIGENTRLAWARIRRRLRCRTRSRILSLRLPLSASWSTCILDMPVVARLTPCTMFSGLLPSSFNFSCSSSLNGHNPLYWPSRSHLEHVIFSYIFAVLSPSPWSLCYANAI